MKINKIRIALVYALPFLFLTKNVLAGEKERLVVKTRGELLKPSFGTCDVKYLSELSSSKNILRGDYITVNALIGAAMGFQAFMVQLVLIKLDLFAFKLEESIYAAKSLFTDIRSLVEQEIRFLDCLLEGGECLISSTSLDNILCSSPLQCHSKIGVPPLIRRRLQNTTKYGIPSWSRLLPQIDLRSQRYRYLLDPLRNPYRGITAGRAPQALPINEELADSLMVLHGINSDQDDKVVYIPETMPRETDQILYTLTDAIDRCNNLKFMLHKVQQDGIETNGLLEYLNINETDSPAIMKYLKLKKNNVGLTDIHKFETVIDGALLEASSL